jgi:hypothetical protein
MVETEQLPISRSMIVAARAPMVCTPEAIDAALAGCDYERAAVLVLARAASALEVPARTIAEIVVGIEHPELAIDLIAIASGDRATALLDALDRRRFPPQLDLSTEMIALYAAWRAGAEPASVVRHGRRLATYRLGTIGTILLAALAREVDDADLRAACQELLDGLPERAVATTAKEIAEDLRAPIDDILARYPEQVAAATPAGFTLRTAPRAGRNDPCPCGSGQKYKRCCADKPREMPSPVPGLSWDEYVRTAADRMTDEDVATLTLRDLVRVDLSRLADRPLIEAFRCFLYARRWDHAARAVDALARRLPADVADGWRDEMIHAALEGGDVAVAEQQLAHITDLEIRRDVELELALARRAPNALELLVEAAERAMRDEDATHDIELAHTLGRTIPTLAVLVGRGAIRAGRPLDNEMLLDMIEEARIALALPAGDRGWDVLAMFEEEEREGDDGEEEEDEEEHELRVSLRHASARVQQLEAELEAQRTALATARETAPAQPRAAIAAEPERVRELRTKIERLEGLVREGVTERAELRQQLASSTATRASREEPARPHTPDDDDGTPVEDTPRDVVIPTFDRRVIDALESMPKAAAAEAMRTIGALAAGDQAAWRRVKQARDMPRQVLMARIGIHYRLIARVEQAQLRVLDLVTREALDTTLKRLRSS